MSGKVFNMTGGSGRGIKLVSIDIAKGPTKTIYRPGQIFDPAGMEVVATYTNGATLLATGWTYYPSGAIQAGTNNIEIVYTESGVTASAMQPITVRTEVFQVPTYTGSFIYNGTQQSPSWNGYESSEMTIGGTTSAIHAGSYQTIFSLKDKIGTQWDDGTVEDKSVDWTIERASIDVPTQSGSLIYDGDIKSPTWAGYDNIKMTIGGTTSGTNAGSYNASFTPKTDYRWSDGTTTAKTVSWSIGKATGTLTVSKTSVELNMSTLSTTFTIGGNHDGTLSVVSNNTGIATVSRSGSTVTVTHVNQTTGSTTITVSCTAGTNYTAPSSKTVNVEAKFVSTVLNDNEWSVIQSVADSSQGGNYWSVGDRKAVTVNGAVGTLSVNGTYYVYILGFDHNSSREGTGITFGTFKTALSGGTDICLVDSHYNSYSTGGQKWFNMNHSSNTNSGGWKGCDLRYDVLGSTNVNNGDATATCATSPVSGTLMAALPSDLRAVMKPMNIYTDNTGGGSNTASYVTKSVDYLPLLAECEIFGSSYGYSGNGYANDAEKNYQQQYQYYKNGNSKVKYRHNSTSSTAIWWERSPICNGSGSFCGVGAGGGASGSAARGSRGLAPAFRV